MSLCISHISAFEFWRTSSTKLPHAASPELALKPKRGTTTAPSRLLRDAVDRLELSFLTQPMHILTPDGDVRCRNRSVKAHLAPQGVPRQAFCDAGKGLFVSSPELCFVQLATLLAFPLLVECGYELCGTYGIQSDEELISRAPLATISSMRKFIDNAPGLYGTKEAARALRYVAEKSASPMETKLAMFLSLPLRLGGYGLSLPRMNQRINFGEKARKTVLKKYFSCDLYWPESKFAVEYESDRYHTGSERIARDSIRRNALDYLGIDVITTTRVQLYSCQEMDKVATVAAKHLGRRIRKTKRDWTGEKIRLRSQLLRHAHFCIDQAKNV